MPALQQPPHWLGANTVQRMMRRVLLALAPVLALATLFFGIGVLLNLALACAACILCEALMLRLRRVPAGPFLADSSALVTAALLALTLPPGCPWWIVLVASLFAVVFAKHLYGGLGYNMFNPAMVGYVVVLIAFPRAVAAWPAIGPDQGWPDPAAALAGFLGSGAALPDAVSGATPLDAVKEQLAAMRTMREIRAQSLDGWLAGYGWEWLNLACLAGGVWLIRRGVMTWHAPVAMLATLAALYFVFFALGSAFNPSPLFGLLSGGTMLAAFFIVTDPVSGAASHTGRLLFGAGVGALTFAMRKWGAYPDGIAFAVLIMNMAAPLIDRYTLPRVYGHRRRP